MLLNVPTDNVVIDAYRKKPAYGIHPMAEDLQKVLEEGNMPKQVGKRKGKAGPSEPFHTLKKKVKKAALKPRSPSPVAQEYSDLYIILDIQEILLRLRNLLSQNQFPLNSI